MISCMNATCGLPWVTVLYNLFGGAFGFVLDFLAAFERNCYCFILSCYASGCNVPSIGVPTGVYVLPFGGVSASEEMLKLLCFPTANCHTHNTQLYLNVFQKCSEFCGGNLRRERTTTFRVVCHTEDVKLYLDVYQKYCQGCKEVSREGPITISNGTPSAADVMRVDCKSQKLKPTDAANVFSPSTSRAVTNTRENPEVGLTTSEATYSRGIHGRPSVNVCQTTTVCSFNFIHDNDVRNTSPSIRHSGRNTCANPKVSLTTGEATYSRDACNTGPSTSHGGRNTRMYPKVSLTTAEATCSSGISRRRSVRRRPSTRGPTVGFTSTAGALFVKCVVTCFMHEQHTLTLILETLISVVVIVDFLLDHYAHHQERILDFYNYISMTLIARVEKRMRRFSGIPNSDLDPQMVEGLIHFLDAYNELVQLFRTTRDKCRELDILEFKIRLYNDQGARGDEFPTSNTLGTMVFESGIISNTDFDVIIQQKDDPTQRINKLNPSYISL
ncbi:hypothetical protein Tco_0947539 [Tanacetum coccineum]